MNNGLPARFRVVPPVANKINQHWSMDFVADQLATGQRIRVLTVIDLFSRTCVLIKTDMRFPAIKFTEALDQMMAA